MQKDTIDSIPFQVKCGNLSYAEGSNKIWAIIYMEPYKYGLENLTEDEKSDFLLSISSDFPRIIRNFNEKHSCFRTYLCRYLENSFRNWNRKRTHDETYEALLMTIATNEYSLQEEPDITFLSENAVFETINQGAKDERKTKKREIAEKIAIILSLRSYSFLSNQNLIKLFRFVNIKPEDFFSMLQNIKEKRNKQDLRKEKIIEARNREFILHLKYEHLLNSKTDSGENYEKLLKHYKLHTRRWENFNKKLCSRSIHCATTEDVAEELNENARKVYFYINHAINKKRVNWEDFIEKQD